MFSVQLTERCLLYIQVICSFYPRAPQTEPKLHIIAVRASAYNGMNTKRIISTKNIPSFVCATRLHKHLSGGVSYRFILADTQDCFCLFSETSNILLRHPRNLQPSTSITQYRTKAEIEVVHAVGIWRSELYNLFCTRACSTSRCG